VRAGSAGNGSTWAAALPNLPATLTRGATYFIADGTYGPLTLDTPNAGNSRITLLKATASNHGTSTGWLPAYGDGQASFGQVNLTTDFWTIDGARRDETNWADGAAYGFAVSGVFTNALVFGHASDDVTIRYTNLGPDDGTTNQASYSGAVVYVGGFTETAENWLLQRNYIHNGRAMGQMAGTNHFVWEYNWLAKNWEKSGIRHQAGRATNMVYRYNIFKDVCQGNQLDPSSGHSCTAILGWYGNGPGVEQFSGSKVYGNIFWDSIGTVFYSTAAIWMGGDRSQQYGGAYQDDCSNCEVMNNTFVGVGRLTTGQIAIRYDGVKTGSQARNNLWFGFGSSYTGCTAAACSNNMTSTNPGIFVNANGGDFRLSADGAAGQGMPLSAPFTHDLRAVMRGAGTWDVGALEF
jgi:hypothetical protein